MKDRLDKIEEKLDLIIELLKPVNAHAPFVDDLKKACQSNRLLRTIITVRDDPRMDESAIHPNQPILAIDDATNLISSFS